MDDQLAYPPQASFDDANPANASAQSEYEELFQSIYDAVFLTDADWQIMDANARAEHHFKSTREILCSLNVSRLIYGAEQLKKAFSNQAGNRKYAVVEAVCLRLDGSRFFAEIVVTRLHEHTGKSFGFFIRDVSARKEAERNLKEASEQLVASEKDQARLDTISTLFYEFNNPLQILVSMAEMDSNKEYKKQLDRIINVLNQLYSQGSLETVTTSDGSTRYNISMAGDIQGELTECDSKRILIADDEPMVRKVYVDAISKLLPDLKVDVADNGNLAVEIFAEKKHGLVILDIYMPVMNGEDAYKAIKHFCEESRVKLPPFIFCTGYIVSGFVTDVVGDGKYHACLKKPFSADDMINAIKKSLSYKQNLAL